MDKMREEVRKAFYDGYDLGDTHRYNESTGGVSMEAAEQQRWESRQSTLQPSAWISCAERLPTEADEYVWVWDADIKAPAIEIWSQVVMFRDRYDYTHWMPTGLTRPQPPEAV